MKTKLFLTFILFGIASVFSMPKEYDDFLGKEVGLWENSNMYTKFSAPAHGVFARNFYCPMEWRSQFNENSPNMRSFLFRLLYIYTPPEIYTYSKELDLLVSRKIINYSFSDKDFVYLTVYRYKNDALYDISNIYHMGDDGLENNKSGLKLDFENDWEISQIVGENGGSIIFQPNENYKDIRGLYWDAILRTFRRADNPSLEKDVKSEILKMLFIDSVIQRNQKPPYTEYFERYDKAAEGSADYECIRRMEEFGGIIEKLSGTWSYRIESTGASHSFHTVDTFAFHSATVYKDCIAIGGTLFPNEIKGLESEFPNMSAAKMAAIQPLQYLVFSSKSTVALNRIYEYQVLENDILRLKNSQSSLSCDLTRDFKRREIVFKNGDQSFQLKWEFDESFDTIKEYVKQCGNWVLYATIEREKPNRR